MDEDTARSLFFNGSVLLILDLPIGSEFGIDFNSWSTGQKFKGIKMIPPGIHFVHFSATKDLRCMPRIGFFHHFKPKEIVVRKWDKNAEDLSDYSASETEIERYRSNLRSLDEFLGPYPYENYKTWYSLTDFLTPEIVNKLRPLDKGRISSQCDLISKEVQDLGASSQIVDRAHPVRQRFFDKQGLPIMHLRPGTEIRFTPLTGELSNYAPSPGEPQIANFNYYDSVLTKMIESCQKPQDVLGEMQFAFVCFLCGHLYEGFEQWKRIVRVACSCRATVTRDEAFFAKFVSVIFFQLKHTPRDFFVDIVSKNNFLTLTLTNFFTNVESNAGQGGLLAQKAAKFKAYLLKEYKWDFDATSADGEPVIVQ